MQYLEGYGTFADKAILLLVLTSNKHLKIQRPLHIHPNQQEKKPCLNFKYLMPDTGTGRRVAPTRTTPPRQTRDGLWWQIDLDLHRVLPLLLLLQHRGWQSRFVPTSHGILVPVVHRYAIFFHLHSLFLPFPHGATRLASYSIYSRIPGGAAFKYEYKQVSRSMIV